MGSAGHSHPAAIAVEYVLAPITYAAMRTTVTFHSSNQRQLRRQRSPLRIKTLAVALHVTSAEYIVDGAEV